MLEQKSGWNYRKYANETLISLVFQKSLGQSGGSSPHCPVPFVLSPESNLLWYYYLRLDVIISSVPFFYHSWINAHISRYPQEVPGYDTSQNTGYAYVRFGIDNNMNFRFWFNSMQNK